MTRDPQAASLISPGWLPERIEVASGSQDLPRKNPYFKSERMKMNWVIQNKEWLFSGAAIAIPLAMAGWILSSKRDAQVQKGGANSTNIQAGRDLSISGNRNDK